MLAIKNNPEEQNPWPTIMNWAPLIPQFENVNSLDITKDIWATEDRAIKNLISVWNKQIRAISIPPAIDHESMKVQILSYKECILEAIRMIPYPPSFSRIAARIIDPAIGASTWALGNQRWIRYKGSFTENARISIKARVWDTKLVLLVTKITSKLEL